jgi:hypothetical protein
VVRGTNASFSALFSRGAVCLQQRCRVIAELSERHEIQIRGHSATIVFIANSEDGRLVIRRIPDGRRPKDVCSITLADPDELRAFFKGLRRIVASLEHADVVTGTSLLLPRANARSASANVTKTVRRSSRRHARKMRRHSLRGPRRTGGAPIGGLVLISIRACEQISSSMSATSMSVVGHHCKVLGTFRMAHLARR